MLKQSPLHIFGIWETFLTSDISNNEICIDEYNMERKDRLNKLGGGIIIHIAIDYAYKRRTDLETSEIERIWLVLTFCHSRSILFA